MDKFVILACLLASEGGQKEWLDRLREADRLAAESRYSEAEAAYVTARQEAAKLGADRLPTATTLNHMGRCFQVMGRLRQAAQAYADALAIVEQRFGAGHPNALRVALD